MRRFVFLAVLTAGLLGLPGRATAAEKVAPRTSSLSWIRLTGAEDCVSTRDLARDVEARLGRSVFVSPSQADVSLEGHIAPRASGQGWEATIVLRDAKGVALGTRELERDEPSCTEMREPLALIAAVMIDPDAALGDTKAPDPAPEPVLPEPIVIVKEKQVFVPAPIDPSRWKFDGGTAVISSLGLLPNPGLGLYAGGMLEPPRLVPIQGFGSVWFDNTAAADGPGRATFSLVFVGGGVCPVVFRRSRVSIYGCVNSHLGLLKSRGEGFSVPRSEETKIYIAGALESRISIRLVGPVAMRAAISGAVPILRDTFTYQRADGSSANLFQMASVIGTADIGFGVVFP